MTPIRTEDADDATLLARYAAGDRAAARLLTARHAPRVFALARRMLREQAEAEDVTQEAMLRLWRIASDWQPGQAQLGTWLYRVASNLCIDRLRRRREIASDGMPEQADEAPGALAQIEADDRAVALRAALETLPDRQRLAVVLRHFEERSNPEIAEILDTSVEAVESLLGRARRELAARLAPRREALGFSDG
ncbi:RNA polymerase sigma-70 factor (ECF subfamily) [Amaricoccus macauensis]|uniref:RNA polymerase sigma-70 factor (ECF subfamily) n=1 Tax=Amaricoccus macauensis TaxID=57001 RepID=A0A840SN74_9RHOB|nr:RNA polymerase sigma factor [Amaricoccus macauensis]MBB5221748.1 RNA polymerase sigma-70 factor (ECF subfamily) [Amaricoccus macauensis]